MTYSHCCHPLPPESMEGCNTCGAGITWVGARCVVALHKRMLWTRTIREAAFIYISTAGRAARRGHPASVTDTVVLGLPWQTSHYICRTVRTIKKRAGGVHFIKCLLNYSKKAFRALHGLHIPVASVVFSVYFLFWIYLFRLRKQQQAHSLFS